MSTSSSAAPTRPIKVGMVSLGCAKNLVDSEVMVGLLARAGCELTQDPQSADVLVVNTCTFIGPAKEESIDTILEMARYKEEGNCKALIVAGCMGTRYKEEQIGRAACRKRCQA